MRIGIVTAAALLFCCVSEKGGTSDAAAQSSAPVASTQEPCDETIALEAEFQEVSRRLKEETPLGVEELRAKLEKRKGKRQPREMTLDGQIGVWVYRHDDAEGVRAATVIAQDRLAEPDLDVSLVSSGCDQLTVVVTRGSIEDPSAILYVERRGTFEILRVESGAPISGPAWTLLTLRRWPSK